MDQDILMHKILKKILGTAKKRGAQRVRVVNLAVYDPYIQPEDLLQEFERLTQNTLAHMAHLYIRCCKNNSINSACEHLTALKTSPTIRLDSIELE